MDVEKDNKIAAGVGALNEFYNPNDIVYSLISCGHIFHHICINRWLERSQTCPQCRAICHRQRIHRIYFNFCERTAEDDLSLPINTIRSDSKKCYANYHILLVDSRVLTTFGQQYSRRFQTSMYYCYN